MVTKQKVANEIVIFFKTFAISVPLAIGIGLLLYFEVWDIDYYQKPTMDGIYDLTYDWHYNEFGYSIKAGAFGSYKNMVAYNEYYGYLPTTKQEMWDKVNNACEYWVRDKTRLTMIYSLLSIFLIPVMIFIFRMLFKIISNSYRWVDRNKTIN